MQLFTYSIFWKIIYRYANVVISFLLILYIIPLLFNFDKNLIMLLPLVLSLFLIYYINRSYLIFYKLVPFKIEADEEKIVCSDFILKQKKVTIYFRDIESLSGGIFSGRFRGIMQVCDGKNKICIGFFDRMKNSTKLVTLILSKVDKKIYDDVIEKIESMKIKPEVKKNK